MPITVFKTSFCILTTVLIVLNGIVNATPLTLYRVGREGRNLTSAILSAGGVTALGVGKSGGTTYAQEEVEAYGIITLVIPVSDGPSITSAVDVGPQTGTAVFVEHASWVYQSDADARGHFNGYERNCTLPGTDGTKSECVVIYRGSDDGTTIGFESTTTYPGTAVPRFTALGPIPTRKNSATYSNRISMSVLGLVFMVCLFQ